MDLDEHPVSLYHHAPETADGVTVFVYDFLFSHYSSCDNTNILHPVARMRVGLFGDDVVS